MNPLMIFRIGIVVSIIAAAAALFYKVYSSGYEACEMKHMKQAIEHENTTNTIVEEVREETIKRVEKVYEAPKSDDGIVAPVLKRTLDQLRSRHAPKADK